MAIVLEGEAGSSGSRRLFRPAGGANPFERNASDEFDVMCLPLGALKRCRVTLSPGALDMGAGWHLQGITVVHQGTGQRWDFPCNDWIDKKDGWEVVLNAAGSDSAGGLTDVEAAREAAHRYVVTLYTADEPGAGTNGEVRLALRGADGFVGLHVVNVDVDGGALALERGCADAVEVSSAKDLGALQSVEVELLPRGLGAAWKLDRVEVVKRSDTKDSTPDAESAVVSAIFPCDRWLGKKGEPLSVVLEAAAAHDDPDDAGSSFVERWSLTFKTSRAPFAGTDASVRVCFVDDQGAEWRPALPGAHDGMFERGQVDAFIVERRGTGPFKVAECRLWLEGKTDGWKLLSLVAESNTGACYAFEDPDGGDVKVEMTEDNAATLPVEVLRPADPRKVAALVVKSRRPSSPSRAPPALLQAPAPSQVPALPSPEAEEEAAAVAFPPPPPPAYAEALAAAAPSSSEAEEGEAPPAATTVTAAEREDGYTYIVRLVTGTRQVERRACDPATVAVEVYDSTKKGFAPDMADLKDEGKPGLAAGDVDIVEVLLEDAMGAPDLVVVRVDATSAGWYLDRVEVAWGPDGAETVFAHGDWIEPGAVARLLPAGMGPGGMGGAAPATPAANEEELESLGDEDL